MTDTQESDAASLHAIYTKITRIAAEMNTIDSAATGSGHAPSSNVLRLSQVIDRKCQSRPSANFKRPLLEWREGRNSPSAGLQKVIGAAFRVLQNEPNHAFGDCTDLNRSPAMLPSFFETLIDKQHGFRRLLRHRRTRSLDCQPVPRVPRVGHAAEPPPRSLAIVSVHKRPPFKALVLLKTGTQNAQRTATIVV
jgi:hypothetical protein